MSLLNDEDCEMETYSVKRKVIVAIFTQVVNI